jgi:hypothetical protein
MAVSGVLNDYPSLETGRVSGGIVEWLTCTWKRAPSGSPLTRLNSTAAHEKSTFICPLSVTQEVLSFFVLEWRKTDSAGSEPALTRQGVDRTYNIDIT